MKVILKKTILCFALINFSLYLNQISSFYDRDNMGKISVCFLIRNSLKIPSFLNIT